MTIRDYFDTLYMAATTDEQFEAVSELESRMFALCDSIEDEDTAAFAQWIAEMGIDTTSEAGREALQQWVWDFDE